MATQQRQWSPIMGWTVQAWRQVRVYPYSEDQYLRYSLTRPADGPSQENMNAEGPAEPVTISLPERCEIRDGMLELDITADDGTTDGYRVARRAYSLDDAIQFGYVRVQEAN